MPENISVGKITGSALCGLCERICIRVKKVTDGCISRLNNVTEENVRLTLIGAIAPVPPFTFISAENSAAPTMQNLAVTTIEGNRVRVSYEAVFPITVTFTDVYNRMFYASGSIVVPRDVILRVPADGRDYSVEISGKILSKIGSVSDDLFTTFVGCIAIITAIIVNADVIIPTYGECVYPDCNNFEDGACAVLFNTPPFN